MKQIIGGVNVLDVPRGKTGGFGNPKWALEKVGKRVNLGKKIKKAKQ